MSARSSQETVPGRVASAPVYPVLLTSYYVLRLYSENTSVFHASQLARPILVLGGAVILCLLVLRYLPRLNIHKAAFGSFALAFLLTLSSELAGLLGSAALQTAGMAVLTLGIVAAALIFRHNYRTTMLLNAVCLSLLVLPVLAIVKADILAPATAPDRFLESVTTAGAGPSYVHIVLDGYSRADVLAETYGHDNQPFLDELGGMGFAVFDEARSPYNQTALNLAAVFSGTYLDFDDLAQHSRSRNELHRMLGRYVGDSSVLSVLRRAGYRTLATDTGYAFSDLATFDHVASPAVGAGRLSLFETRLLARSGLGFLMIVGRAASAVAGSPDGRAEPEIGREAERLNLVLRYAFESPVPGIQDGNFFLYQHILAPHPPFTIDRDGRDWTKFTDRFGGIADGSHAVRHNEDNRVAYMAGYIEKLRYTNAALLARLRRLIEQTPEPLIIVLHGDHGGGAYYDQEDLSLTCARERFSPLLAVYASDPAWRDEIRNRLQASPNLVNIYRAIFATVYDADIPVLGNNSYYAPWNDTYQAIPVSPERLAESCGKTE
ncbi:MAG: sulfatase-like hydrolase/transferase [Alphaproteobacteria bacterium]